MTPPPRPPDPARKPKDEDGVPAHAFALAFAAIDGAIGATGSISAFTIVAVAIAGAIVLAFLVADLNDKVIPWRNRNLRRLLGAHTRRSSARGAAAAMSGLRVGAGWRAMVAVAWLMPRAAGRRWLAEAGSFLYEAPAALQRGAIRSYLAGAPQVIAVSWAGELARRTRIAGTRPPR